jgi:dolichyl-phosphate-mannose--protein O-mannosyl transferase
MLDIFIPLFGIAGFYFLVLDRDRASPDRSIWDRPWRLAAGAAFGAAIATKWSGGLFLVAGLMLALVWGWSARRARPAPERGSLRSEVLSVAVYLVVLPILLYALSYAGRVDGTIVGAPWKEGHVARNLWNHHDYMLDFHRNLASRHSYQSPAWSWIALKRPVSYYFCSDSTDPPCPEPAVAGDYGEIFATGNPFVWWTSILAMLYVAYRWVRTRNFRGPEGVILAGFAFTYLPWLTPMLDRPAIFIFYLLPTIPFMALAIGYVVTRIGTSWEAKSAVALFATATVGVFAFYHPLLVGTPIPQPDWDARIWVFDNCDPPVGNPTTSTVTETIEGQATTRVVETTEDVTGLPPPGWCWI